jgi:hypothetical protein
MQWVMKGQPDPIKARVYVTIHTNYTRGKTVNAEYVEKAVVRYLKDFSIMFSQHWLCTGTTPRSTPLLSQRLPGSFLAVKGIKTICHAPYSLDLAPVNLFLYERVRSELLDSRSPRTASKRARRGSSVSLPRTSSPLSKKKYEINYS